MTKCETAIYGPYMTKCETAIYGPYMTKCETAIYGPYMTKCETIQTNATESMIYNKTIKEKQIYQTTTNKNH